MRKTKLYQAERANHHPIFIAARTENHAARIYVTIEVAEGRDPRSFSINASTTGWHPISSSVCMTCSGMG